MVGLALGLAGAAGGQPYLITDLGRTPGGPLNSNPATGFAALGDGRVLYSTQLGVFVTGGEPGDATRVSTAVIRITSAQGVNGRAVFLDGPADAKTTRAWTADGATLGPLPDVGGQPLGATISGGLVAGDGRACT